jgi:L-amino acid N-acyltransferase YncA
MDIQIRNVEIEDARGIVDILNPIIETGIYTVFTKPLSEDEEKSFILNFPKRGVFNIAFCDKRDNLLGFQDIAPFETFTGAFNHVGVIATYVDLKYHRRGISKKLFEANFREARDKGYEKLFTYVRADNQKGLSAYLFHDFKVVGTAKKQAKINGDYIDEIFIEKFL